MALQEVELSTSGHFVCQITMDSPPFEFVEAGGTLTVISLPERFPVISGNKGHHYGPGDRVTLNCTCYDTFPAATIRWFINGREVIYILQCTFALKAIWGHEEVIAQFIDKSLIWGWSEDKFHLPSLQFWTKKSNGFSSWTNFYYCFYFFIVCYLLILSTFLERTY